MTTWDMADFDEPDFDSTEPAALNGSPAEVGHTPDTLPEAGNVSREVFPATDPVPAPPIEPTLSAGARKRLEGTELVDPDRETAVIGAMLIDADSATAAVHGLTPDDFGNADRGRAFAAAVGLHVEGAPVHALALRDELRRMRIFERLGGHDWISRAIGAAGSGSVVVVADDLEVIRRLARARREKAAIERLVLAETEEHRARARAELVEALEGTAPGRNLRVPSFPLTDAVTLDGLDLPDIEAIVGHDLIFRGGVTFMVAPYKVGKSMCTLGLAVDVATGRAENPQGASWLGLEVLASGVVHVYTGEGGLRLVRRRLRKMVPFADPGLERLKFRACRPLPRLDDDGDLDAVFSQAEADGAVLIVIDPLGRFWSMEDEKDPRLLRDLLERVQVRAAAAYGGRGIAVLIVHHDTKAAGEEGTRATGGRGSGKIADDADGLINLKTTRDEKVVLRVAISRWDESPPAAPFTLCPDTLRFIEADYEPERRPAGAAVQQHSNEGLLRALGKAVGACTTADWSELAEVSKRTLERRLPALIEEAGSLLEVVHGDRGTKRYRLSFEGREVLR